MKTIDELGWDDAGEATTLVAAAADADEWLALIERLHNNGCGPWKFSDPDSAVKLRGCRASLRRFIDAERAKDQPAKAHDSLRDRISSRMSEDIQPDYPATRQSETPKKKKPTGFVAICQCGVIVGAMDWTHTERREAGQILGRWLASGCTVDPRFTGTWEAYVERCQCQKQPTKSED